MEESQTVNDIAAPSKLGSLVAPAAPKPPSDTPRRRRSYRGVDVRGVHRSAMKEHGQKYVSLKRWLMQPEAKNRIRADMGQLPITTRLLGIRP